VSVDDVYFGEDETDSSGAFSAALRPGGMAAGVAQSVDRLQASDGSATAATTFTVTRTAGARLVGSGLDLLGRVHVEVWGFALDGRPREVYLHYVSPGGTRGVIALGRTGGACGYLLTPPRRIFPSTPSLGTWQLQVDTERAYRSRPPGPAARIRVGIK
jgi:hypothetical protein